MSFVTTEIQGAVAIVIIDRPKALNALNPEVLSDRCRRQELCCRC